MADSKLSDLTAATTVAPADLVYTVQGGTSKKASRETIQTYDAGTLTTDKKILDLSATWNASGVTFTGLKLNVTNTASASGSKVFDFQIGGSTQLALTATGLGVGTASPGYKLDVSGSARVTTAFAAGGAPTGYGVLQAASNDTSEAPRQLSIRGTTDGNKNLWLGYNTTNNYGGIQAIIDGTGYSPLVLQPSGANVGIATTSPSYLLSLGGNSARTFGMERHTTSNTAGNNLTVLAGGATSGATDKNGGTLALSSGTATGTGSSVITFATAAAGSTGTTDRAPAERMRIDGSGNVGIATTSPSNLLTVGLAYGGTPNAQSLALIQSTTNTYLTIAASNSSDSGILFADSDDNNVGALGYNHSTNAMSFRTNDADRLYLSSGGILQFAGTTSSFPALKRSSTTLQVRLADDSADAPFSCGKATIQTLTVGLGGQTSVASNTAVGYQALDSASLTGIENTGIGYANLTLNTSGSYNSALGRAALYANTTGSQNTAVGHNSLTNNTTGGLNTAVGLTAAGNVSTASNNSSFGAYALRYFNTSNNVAVGYEALKGGSTTVGDNTGANNIGIGYRAGDAITSGSSNIAIGYDVDVDSATASNQINIGGVYFHDRLLYTERADPAAPAADKAIVYARDNGSGKTQLCVRFNTGAVQVIATEP